MSTNIKSVIIGTGSFVPSNIIPNKDFSEHRFYEKSGEPILRENSEVIQKFQDITEIEERRYA
ncbi:MAG: hypothetical protein B7Y19_09535, partial [Sphingobacteriales bacterium 24-40-4]